jgi:hypothetical protein
MSLIASRAAEEPQQFRLAVKRAKSRVLYHSTQDIHSKIFASASWLRQCGHYPLRQHAHNTHRPQMHSHGVVIRRHNSAIFVNENSRQMKTLLLSLDAPVQRGSYSDDPVAKSVGEPKASGHAVCLAVKKTSAITWDARSRSGSGHASRSVRLCGACWTRGVPRERIPTTRVGVCVTPGRARN